MQRKKQGIAGRQHPRQFGKSYIECLKQQTNGEGGLHLEEHVLKPALHEHWGLLDGLAVCEGGCGFGMNLLRLLEPKPGPKSIQAVDLSPDMLALAKDNIHDRRVKFRSMSMAALKFPDDSFDLFTSAFVLENMPFEVVEASFLQIARVLRKGGRFTVAMMHPTWLLLVSGQKLGNGHDDMQARFARYNVSHEVIMDRGDNGVYSRTYHPLEAYFMMANDAKLSLVRCEPLCIPSLAVDPDLPAKYHPKIGLPVFLLATWQKKGGKR